MGVRDAAEVLASNVKELAKNPKKYVAERSMPAYGEALSGGTAGKAAAEIKGRKTRLDEEEAKATGYRKGGVVKTKPAGFKW